MNPSSSIEQRKVPLMDLTDEMIKEFICEAQTCMFLQYVKRLRK